MRTLLRGLAIGALLSALRAPAGLDLVSIPAASASAALGWRAAALALAGLALFVALRRPNAWLLFATATGFALHGLVLARWLAPESTFALALTLVFGVVVVCAVCLDERKYEDPAGDDPPHAHAAARAAERLGLFAAGCGAALSVDAVGRHVRAFGTAHATDDTCFALAFLVLAALGALGLGWVARLKMLRGLSLPLGLAAAAVCGFVALAIAGRLEKTLLLERYVKSFGVDLGSAGTPAYDLLVGAALFVAPALCAGFALAGARNGAQLLAVCAGAAQGVLAGGILLGSDAAQDSAQNSTYASQLVPAGVLLAVAGALLAQLSTPCPRKLARYALLAATLALVTVPLSRETLGLPLRAPWSEQTARSTRTFLLALDTPEGLLTVESIGGGPPVATLDGRALTTGLDGALGELSRLQLAAQCVPEERRVPRERQGQKELRALLVGQLDPLRGIALQQQGFTHVDRTASWHAAMERVESKFFKDIAQPLPGDRLAPAEARERIARGDYALVVVPAVGGDAPALGNLDVPPETTLVVWLRADAGLASAHMGGDVLVASVGLDELCLAVTRHAARPARASAVAPCFVSAGEPLAREFPLAQALRKSTPREPRRADHERARTLTRLAHAATGPRAEFFGALAEIAQAQAASSPFESAEARVELPDDALVRLRDATIALEPDAFVRSTWDGIARTLAGKRDVARVRAHLEPLARARGPWPEIEKALARADLEALEPEDAVRRLAALEALARDDFDYWALAGEARQRAGDRTGAVQAWRRALELRPNHPSILRRLGPALVRLGDPQGRAIIEQLLKSRPDDPELTPFLGPGPWPETSTSAAPAGG